MFSIQDLTDIETLSETCELECKLANGRDGLGQLPNDFWPTYSAMANTRGGTVLLGIKEKSGIFSISGIENPERIKKDLFSTLNNKLKVNINLISDNDVNIHNIDGKNIISIYIPSASRKQKPIFINGDIFKGTYKRLNEGDIHCDDETVKRMLAEQVEDERDAKILKNYTFSDLDLDSIKTYRQLFSVSKPAHPWLELELFDFVKMLRGWRKDRETGEEGFTIAGILMFGTWNAIQDAAPHYFVDYQERPEAKTELRWVDRLVPDGSWSGNLFDFYRRVYRKLITDIKVRFELTDGQRQDDSPIHIALREALVNTLVHADYTGRVSILVVKRPDMFGFRNPGLMRVPHELAIKGSHSDCRNRILHQMFLMIGLGERAGSGLPKIFSGWSLNHWRQPLLREIYEPEQTLLELHMADLIPSATLDRLSKSIGPVFSQLPKLEQLIIATAESEDWINHERICEITDEHPRTITLSLSKLERQNILTSTGSHKNKVYHLPGVKLVTPDNEFGQKFIKESFIHEPDKFRLMLGMNKDSGNKLIQQISQELSQELSREPSQESSQKQSHEPSHEPLSEEARDKIQWLTIDSIVWNAIKKIADQFNDIPKRKATPEQINNVICDICQYGFLTLSDISNLLNRKPDSLRRDYLTPMVKSGELTLAFPHAPTHSKQGYMTTRKIYDSDTAEADPADY